VVPEIFSAVLRCARALADTPDRPAVAAECRALWAFLLAELMALPPYHRSRYQALKLFLEAAPALDLLALRPSFLQELLLAVKDRDIAASVSSLFLSLCQRLAQAGDLSPDGLAALRRSLVDGLSSPIAALRVNLADYLLPDLSRLPGLFHPLDMLAVLLPDPAQAPAQAQAAPVDPVGRLWAAVQFSLQAKALGLFDALEADPSLGPLRGRVLAALREAALSEDDSLRLSALLAVSASQKTTGRLTASEEQLMADCLLASLKTAESDDCAKIATALRLFLVRAKCSRPSAALPGQPPATEEDVFGRVLDWLLPALKAALQWPGAAPHDSEYAHLVALQAVFEAALDLPANRKAVAPAASSHGPPGQEPLQLPRDKRLLRHLGPDLLATLLRCLTADWDRTRRLAASLLLQLPRPWASQGIRCEADLRPVLGWAQGLAESARLKESEAGALALFVVFRVFAWDLAWPLFPAAAPVLPPATDPRAASSLGFLGFCLVRLERVVADLARVFRRLQSALLGRPALEEEPEAAAIPADCPLGHGLLLTLRLCLQHLLAHGQAVLPRAQLAGLVQRTLLAATSALRTAMEVVAEPSRQDDGDGLGGGAKGPVNSTAYSMAATFVNTNSFSAAGEEAEGLDGLENGPQVDGQRAIVAAWLLVKEATALLAALVELCPPPAPAQASEAEAVELLSVAQIEAVGETLLDALGRLKHMGAIAEAHVALQAVCSALFKLGERHGRLSGLPLRWLDGLLERLYGQRQIFILRRSAGYAYSFLSILRAEPSNAQAVLLGRAMAALMAVVRRGLPADQTEAEAEGDRRGPETFPGPGPDGWKLSVHALNVVRLVLLDSAFGRDLDGFVAELMVLIVRGFGCGLWAVRNSAMMCFAAVVQRLVSRRDKNHSAAAGLGLGLTRRALGPAGSSALGKLSDHGHLDAADFLQRFPLRPLLTAFFAAHPLLRARGDGLDGPGEQAESSLVAVLLLFSKFKLLGPAAAAPSADGETAEEPAAALDLVELRPFFERALFLPASLQVRQVAAKAVAKIVPAADFGPELLRCIAALEELVAAVLGAEDQAAALDGRKFEIHGRLLLATELLGLWLHFSLVYGLAGQAAELDGLQGSLVPALRRLVDGFFRPFPQPLLTLAVFQAAHFLEHLLHLHGLLAARDEVRTLKHGLGLGYLLATRGLSARTAGLFPGHPHAQQRLLEAVLREAPLTPLAVATRSAPDRPLSLLQWLAGRCVLLTAAPREEKLAVLAGLPAFFEEAEDEAESDRLWLSEEFGLLLRQMAEAVQCEADEVVAVALVQALHR
jgi:hypothetical protein